jgi:hypothetical protein
MRRYNPREGQKLMAKHHQSRIPGDERARLGQTAYKRELAYQRLGIRPEDVQCMPFFRASLSRIARLLNRPHGRGDQPSTPVCVFDCLQYSNDLDVLRVLNLYRSVPASYRRLLPMEAFCHAAAVSPQVVLANIAAGAVRMNASAAAIVAGAWHPQVVLKTVKERMVLHRAAGFFPHCGGWK